MKKRVHVPFPPAPNLSTVVKPPPKKVARVALAGRDNKHNALMKEREERKRKEIYLIESFSADRHVYSVRLCAELESLKSQPSLLPPEILNLSQSSGRIKFDVQVVSASSTDDNDGDATTGSGHGTCYGCGVWSFTLGGGVGDDLSPVGLRCTNQLSHYQVDDMGFVTATFWKVVGRRGAGRSGHAMDSDEEKEGLLPSLLDVLTGVVDMLKGPFVRSNNNIGSHIAHNAVTNTNGYSGAEREHGGEQDLDGYSAEEHRERWEIAAKESERKMKTKLAYRSKALLPALVTSHSSRSSGSSGSSGDDDACSCASRRESESDLIGSGWPDSGWPDMTWFAPSFLELLAVLRTLSDPSSSRSPEQAASAEDSFRSLVTENSPGIFTFDLFSLSFCDALLKELDNYEASGLPQRRPNTMNNYGLVVNEMGMQPLMDSLLTLVAPVAKKLFHTEPVVYGLDHHHSFIVQYKSNQLKGDRGLDMHHDASEVTMNICLGRDSFQGGDLLFCGMAGEADHRKYQFSLKHVKGRAVMHLGRHRHGAEDILPTAAPAAAAASLSPPHTCTIDPTATTSTPTSVTTSATSNNDGTRCEAATKTVNERNSDAETSNEGVSIPSNSTGVDSERLNLIMWLRSSVFRSAAAYGHISPDGFPKVKEDVEPDICCLSKYNDTDYHTFVQTN
jgi:hypothetical protein